MKMSFLKVAKSDQEQAVASWINYLNQVRLDKLMNAIDTQNINFEKAMHTLKDTVETINKNIIERNRGGLKGMHGFIAEAAQVGVGNAREEIKGKAPIYEWVNDNGPVDLIKNGVDIQQKFVNSGNHLSLNAIKQHLEKYPDYIANGGKYQIPRDHYEKIKDLLSIPKDKANKMPTSTGEFSLKQWQEVHDFFKDGKVDFDDIEPSDLDYKDVQVNQINHTIDNEKASIKDTDNKIREKAYEQSKPTFEQAAKVATVSAAIEGASAFIAAIIKKRKSGKEFKDFTSEDWKEIFNDTGIGSVKGGIRGISIYALTNYTATPAAVASAICTASFGVAEQIYLFRKGKISYDDLIVNSEILCLDCSVSALSSLIGQAVIPVPVLGAVIGNTVGTFLYNIIKENFTRKEYRLLKEYLKLLAQIDTELESKYNNYIDNLKKSMNQYYFILEKAFSPNYLEAFDGSVALAQYYGIPTEDILKNMNDIDRYFLE